MNGFRLPLVTAFLAFLGGILAGLRLGAVTPAMALAAAPLVVGILLHRRIVGVPLRRGTTQAALLGALTLAGAGDAAQARTDAARDCRSTLEDGTRLVLTGALAADFAPPPDSTERIPLLPLAVRRAAAPEGAVRRCEVEVRTRLPRGAGALAAGTELRVAGEWRLLPAPVERGRWPESPTYRGYLLARSAAVLAPPRFTRHPLLALRGRSERQIRRLFPRTAPLADALVLGRRETLDRGLADRFAAAGLTHLLAISGTHVALVAAVLVLLGRVARIPRDATLWLTIALIALYLAMIGAPPSAVRSGVMTALTLLTFVLQRPSAPLAIMAAAAFVILALDPLSALDAGFQLSFAGVLGIGLLRHALLQRVPRAWRRGKVLRPLAESMVVSVAAFVATAPIVAEQFGQVAPVSIVANLPAIPLTSLAIVGIGAACAVEPVSPALARLIADGASLALEALTKVVDAAAAVPGGHAQIARPQWWLWAAAGIALLLALEWGAGMRRRVRWAVASGAAGAAFLLLPVAVPTRGVEIAFLDVGQGDAIAIHTPAGRWLLVDAGPWDEEYDAGEKRVLPWLRAHGARRIEAMVLTHPHVDHIGGAAAVMRGMPVGRLIEPGLPFGTPVYLGVLKTAEERHVPWSAARQDRTLRIDGLELAFLWPTVDVLDAPADANDISAVIRLRYGAFAALLTGDAPASVEHLLVARYGGEGLRADVLKAGHHGSRTASSQELLDAVRPALAVISCGRRNKYGHPAPETLARFRADGVPVARTDEDGTVVVRVDPGGGAWRREDP